MNIIMIGGGKTIYFLARQFTAKGYRLTIINRNPAEARWLSEQVKALVILGEGSDPSILEEAGARRADVLLCLTPHDQDNLIACQLAGQMFGVSCTIAMVNDPENEAIFTRLGITDSFSGWGRVLLIFTMFWGRLGPLTLVVALAQRSRETLIAFPEEKIIIG